MIRQREQGFSLVEVILALGILAGVLISIAGLFIMGSKQVKSGRTSTFRTLPSHQSMVSSRCHPSTRSPATLSCRCDLPIVIGLSLSLSPYLVVFT